MTPEERLVRDAHKNTQPGVRAENIRSCLARRARLREQWAAGVWAPSYSPWRHGGWYVDNVCYPSGAVGCVSRNYDDHKWRIVCDDRSPQPTYRSRYAAACAEFRLAFGPSRTYSLLEVRAVEDAGRWSPETRFALVTEPIGETHV